MQQRNRCGGQGEEERSEAKQEASNTLPFEGSEGLEK